MARRLLYCLNEAYNSTDGAEAERPGGAALVAPRLFIYYDIPSYAYRDRGIGTLSFGWAVFMWAAFSASNGWRHRVW